MPSQKATTLTSPRLILRPYKASDWQAVHEYARNPKVCRYTDWGPNTVRETKKFIQDTIKDTKKKPRMSYDFAITLKNNGELIGGCRIYTEDPENKEAHIGYTLNPKYWHKGYATESAKTLLNFAFKKLKFDRVSGTCAPQNKASQAVMEKIGMKYEGRLLEHLWLKKKKKWRDSLLYAIAINSKIRFP